MHSDTITFSLVFGIDSDHEPYRKARVEYEKCSAIFRRLREWRKARGQKTKRRAWRKYMLALGQRGV